MDAVVLPLVQFLCGHARPFGDAVALGFEHKGEIVGGLVFHNWSPEHGVIEVSAGSTNPRWLCRSILAEATAYAFDRCACQSLVTRTSPENSSVLKIWRALGAAEVEIPHLRGRGKPETVFVLTQDAWNASRLKR